MGRKFSEVKKMLKINKIIMVIMMVALMFTFVASVVFASDYAFLRASLLNQDPDPAEPGKYVEVRFKVVKYGNSMIEDISYTLDVDYPFSFDRVSDSKIDVGDWRGYSNDKEFYTLYYKLRVDKDALEGDYKLKLNYMTKGVITSTEEFTIRIGERKKPSIVIGALSSSPIRLAPGNKDSELKIDFENIGDGDARHIQVELELPEKITSSYSFSNRVILGTINSGSSKTGSFFIDIDENLKEGIYPAKAIISYKEENDPDNKYRTMILPVDIMLKDIPRFSIEKVEYDESKSVSADMVDIFITIKNIGGKKAESVSIRGFKESSQPFEYDEKSDYIGNLESGESGIGVLKLSVKKDAVPKDYLLSLEIRAIDNSRVLVENKQFMVTVFEKEKETLIPPIAIYIVVGIIIAVISFILGRRRSNE
jgi:hypothetical protein